MPYEFYTTGRRSRDGRVRASGTGRGRSWNYIELLRQRQSGREKNAHDKSRRPPFAPPFLKDTETIVAQTAAILLDFGARHGLAPKDPEGGLWTHQIQLTISDFVAEGQIAIIRSALGSITRTQRDEARRRAEEFRREPDPEIPDLQAPPISSATGRPMPT